MMRARCARALGLVATTTSLVAACGGGQTRLGAVFSNDWHDDGGARVRAVQARILATPIARNAPAAVGVFEGGLVGVALGAGGASDGAVWSYAHAVDARPLIAGSVVVGSGGGQLFALDAGTGRPLWVRPSGGSLRGMGDDGRTTVMSLARGSDNGSVVLAVAHDGIVVRQLETPVTVGMPGVVGNYAFLPWQGQYVTVYNLQSGEEEARLLFREQVSRTFSHGGKLYVGELGLFRFDEEIWQASNRKASHVGLPAYEIPGDPKWFRPGAELRGPSSDAFDKIALYAAPNDGAPLALDSDRFVATYYKIAAGFDAKSGAMVWVARRAADLIAGSAFAGGIALCDADGQITILRSANGAPLGSTSLGRKLTSCAVEADGLGPARGADSASQAPLSQQLAEVIGAGDDEIAMQRVLLHELGKQADPKATKLLVDLAGASRTPEALVPDVEAALALRRTGADYMLEALRRHYDFLKDVLRPPPVGPLADALLAMKETRAAPALVSHLFDPADTSDAVRRVAAALAEVATKAEVAQLRNFFGLYRTTAEDDNLAQAVVSVARALVRVGGVDEKALVAKGAEDPLTVPIVKVQLASLMEPSARETP
jgi:outer membrane protein assembly factor BamB